MRRLQDILKYVDGGEPTSSGLFMIDAMDGNTLQVAERNIRSFWRSRGTSMELLGSKEGSKA
ncbi:MAG: hypothetical protein BA066_01320 [Candidatus Korarchaeota archaeon NZ13-K]|nr:MAG: hypothetical protein BA066_01320 [Candidatus Korarchaeota archaeon NZ13-K]